MELCVVVDDGIGKMILQLACLTKATSQQGMIEHYLIFVAIRLFPLVFTH